MKNEKDLYLVFTGSQIDGSFIKEMLEDNDIGVLIKNSYSQSIMAGWIESSPNNDIQVFVTGENFMKAGNLIEVFMNSRA